MVNEGSSRYNAIKLGSLIKLYANSNSSYAKSELSNKVITGEDLIEAMDYANLAFEDAIKLEAKYKKLEKIFNIQRKAFLQERENYLNLKDNLEKLIKEEEDHFSIK